VKVQGLDFVIADRTEIRSILLRAAQLLKPQLKHLQRGTKDGFII
jgi:hypothetical protein